MFEKTLQEMHAEYEETKVSAGSKASEPNVMNHDASKKYAIAEAKMRAAEVLLAQANRCHQDAKTRLKEVEIREDDLSRTVASFKSMSETKNHKMVLERHSLDDRVRSLQQEHVRIADAQRKLNIREDRINGRSQRLAEHEYSLASLAEREESLSEREASLVKKEQELLDAEAKIADKESELIQNVEYLLRQRKYDVEAELESKCKKAEEEIERKRLTWELKEVDIKQREEIVRGKEHDLEIQSMALAEKEKDITERSYELDEKEKNLNATDDDSEEDEDDSTPLSATPISWIKRCTNLIFKSSPEEPSSSEHNSNKKRKYDDTQKSCDEADAYSGVYPKTDIDVAASGSNIGGNISSP